MQQKNKCLELREGMHTDELDSHADDKEEETIEFPINEEIITIIESQSNKTMHHHILY